jgi:DNA-binding PadR family transcriptional regulator
MAEQTRRDEIPPGTLYMLILSDDVLQVEEGSLYPVLQRMLLKGWVTAEWGVTAGNRRARYYRLTAEGRKQLLAEVEQYQRVNGAIHKILQTV